MLMASVRFAEFNGPLLVVPVPSSPGAKRRRGYDAIDQLARSSAKLLRKDGVDCRARQVLRHRRPVADQSGLSAVDRWRNLHGALEARERRVLSGRSVLVVDDILTTGATASDAVRALTMVGYRPLGIAVIAATARDPGRPRAE
ncbi:MAG: ComF family protein, partial [Propionibacteriales bacterium]|nr:ComF family protein [Propionibacteriales bacterium]